MLLHHSAFSRENARSILRWARGARVCKKNWRDKICAPFLLLFLKASKRLERVNEVQVIETPETLFSQTAMFVCPQVNSKFLWGGLACGKEESATQGLACGVLRRNSRSRAADGFHIASVTKCAESCSENAPEFWELLCNWTCHSVSVFLETGVIPGF